MRGYSGLKDWPSSRYRPSSFVASSLRWAIRGSCSTAGRASGVARVAWVSMLSLVMRSAFALSSASDRVPSSWLTRACRSPTRSPMRSPPTNRMSFSSRNWLRCVSLALQGLPGFIHLGGQEPRGVLARVLLVVELLGDDRVGQRVHDVGGQLGATALERDLDQPRVPDRLDPEPLEERVGQLPRPTSDRGELGLALEVHEPDDPVGERAALQEAVIRLQLGLRESPAFSSRPVGSNFRIRGSSFSMRSIAVPVNTGRAVTLQTNAVRTAPRNTSATSRGAG